MISHLLLDFFFMMIGAMIFHELGHYIKYNADYPGNAYIKFKKGELYTDVVCFASDKSIKHATIWGLLFGTLPIIFYSSISVLFVSGFIFYFWGSRHDIKLLWRMRK